MAKKPGLSKIDFNFGIGEIIPSTKEARIIEGSASKYKVEKASLTNFKDALGKHLDSRLTGVTQFPSNNEVFVFVMQYFVSQTEYHCRDIDNMAKTILDVLKGRFYSDDNQVKVLLIAKKIEIRRVPQNFAYVAIREIKGESDIDILRWSGIERSVTLYQELKSQGLV